MTAPLDLTFLAWSDTHFGYDQRPPEQDIRYQAVRQMAAIAGTPYPPELGGRVGSPELVTHCGDFVDGRPEPADMDLYLDCVATLPIPSYETLGNHETGNPAAEKRFVERRGGRYYAFDHGGVRFISLDKIHGLFGYPPPMDSTQLEWLERQVTSAPRGTPIVTLSHAEPDDCPNAADLDAVLKKGNVVLQLIGHTHLQWSGGHAMQPYRWGGRTCLILGHCRNHWIDPPFGRSFVVIRITPGKMSLVPWRWDLGGWARFGEEQEPEHLVVDL